MSLPSDSDGISTDDARSLRASLLLLAEGVAEESAASTTERVTLLQQLLGADVCRRLAIYPLPADFLLSVVIPVFNEQSTIEAVVERVRSCGLPCEIVIVDDCSTDGTRDVLARLEEQPGVKIILHAANQGKGGALKTGFANVSGDVVVIQDADMEYDPRDFRLLLQPILEDRADVVYGSRYANHDRAVPPYWHHAANWLITALASLRYGLKFTDVETCYKMFRREVIDEIGPALCEKRFGVEIEMTARIARRKKKIRFYERPISYSPRWYNEGKKIGWRDGVRALWCMLAY